MPIQLSVRAGEPFAAAADIAVFGVFTLPAAKGKEGDVPAPLKPIDHAIGGGLQKLLAKEEFTGKRDQALSFGTLGRAPFERIVLIGLGDRGKLTDADVRSFAGKAARAANGDKAKSMALVLPAGTEARLRYAAEGVELGAYRFTKYLTGDRKPKSELEAVTIVVHGGKVRPAEAKKAVDLGQAVARGVNLARDLSNEPPNVIFPAALAAEAQKVAKTHKLAIQVFDYKEILKRGMKLIDAVGRGSSHEPRFVHMSYVPAKAKKKLVFIGKGICFDSGGLSIKPAQGMGEMKHDMSGAANVVGLMEAVAALEPKVEVHGIFAAAENMPDGNAYRPGDVWGSLDGKTVEIINTDAEGRLVLADALAYARALQPDIMVDNATLTGACVVALGNTCSGFYASNDATGNEYAAAAKVAGEQTWRMPLLEDLREQIKSEVADVKQTGDRFGGSITAALFLREFIGDTKNWVHADIAGPASADRPSGWTQAKGATGHAVLTFIALIERASK